MAKTSTRPARIPVSGERSILTVQGKDPAYEYRFVNDLEGGMRIQRFKDGGWEIVMKEGHTVGDKAVDSGSTVGAVTTRYVGQGVTAVLMRIPKEWYDEDQMAKQDKIDEIEEGMRQAGQTPGSYGNISISKRS